MTEFSKEAAAKFPTTIAQIGESEMYVHCPDCDASGQVYLYRTFDDRSSGNYYPCVSCHGTKEMDADDAADFIRAWEEDQGIEAPV